MTDQGSNMGNNNGGNFETLVKNLYTTYGKDLTNEKLQYINSTYGNGKEMDFVKNFYATYNIPSSPKKLNYIQTNYLKKKEPSAQGVGTMSDGSSPISNGPKPLVTQPEAPQPEQTDVIKLGNIDVHPTDYIATVPSLSIKNVSGDVNKLSKSPYPTIPQPQLDSLQQVKANLEAQPQTPETQQKLNNLSSTLKLYSPEADSIYKDVAAFPHDINSFLSPNFQNQVKQQLVQKYGETNLPVINNVLDYFNSTQKRKAFYDAGQQLDKAKGITPQQLDTEFKAEQQDIFGSNEAKAEQLYSIIKQQNQSTNPDQEVINQARWQLNSMGYSAKWANDYQAGYRIVKKDETPSGYDNLVNNFVNVYKDEPIEKLQEVAKQNYVIYKALQAKQQQIAPAVQQINKNKIAQYLQGSAAGQMAQTGTPQPIEIPSYGTSGYAPTVRDTQEVLYPDSADYPQKSQALEAMHGSLIQQLDTAQARFEGSVRALHMKQGIGAQGSYSPAQPSLSVSGGNIPQTGKSGVEDKQTAQADVSSLLNEYDKAVQQYQKQPIKQAGTLKEVQVKAVPTTSYWYNLSRNLPYQWNKNMPINTQKFIMALGNQSQKDIESGAILQSPTIAKVAPDDYKQAVKEQQQKQVSKRNKAEWFKKASLQELGKAAEYQNPPVALVQQQYQSGQLGTMTTSAYEETGAPSPQKQLADKISKDGEVLDKLGSYATLLEPKVMDKNNPNRPADIQKYNQVVTAYTNLLPEYQNEIKDFQGKQKEFPYYVPYNDVNILSKETGIPVATFDVLNNSIIGKGVNSLILGNPDFRNYDPSGLTKVSHALMGLIIDAPLFWGVGGLADGLTDIALKGLSRVKLTEGVATSINDLSDATKVLIEKGLKPSEALAEASIQLPKDAAKIKAILTALNATKEGMTLSGYNIGMQTIKDIQGIHNATKGTKVVVQGDKYTITGSDGDNVRMIDDNGNEKEMSKADYKKMVKFSFSDVGREGLIGFAGGAMMPEAKILSESIMKGAGITSALPNSMATLVAQSYSFAAAASFINTGKAPSFDDFKSSLILFTGMKAGGKLGELLTGKRPFDKYFGEQKSATNKEYLNNVIDLEKKISTDKKFVKMVQDAVIEHNATEASKNIMTRVTTQGDKVVTANKDGKPVFIVHGAKVDKDGKVTAKKGENVVTTSFNEDKGQWEHTLASPDELKDVSSHNAEDFHKDLHEQIKETQNRDLQAQEGIHKPSSTEKGVTPPQEEKVATAEAKPVTEAKPTEAPKIEPNKSVKANRAIAIKDVLDGVPEYYDLGGKEAGMLDGKFKDRDNVVKQSDKGNTLTDKTMESLTDKGYVELNPNNWTYTLTDKGNKFLDAVDARYETRKGLKQGTDMFPETANVKETNKPQANENKNQSRDINNPELAKQGKTSESGKAMEPISGGDKNKPELTSKKVFTTSDGERVSGKRLTKALNKVADDEIRIANKIREGEYASHVTEKRKDEILSKDIAFAEKIRRGENLDNFTVWQRVNRELTGKDVSLFSKAEATKPTIEERKAAAQTKISEGLDDLMNIMGAKKSLMRENPISKPDVYKAIKKIAEGLYESGIIKSEELLSKLADKIKGAGITRQHLDEYKDKIIKDVIQPESELQTIKPQDYATKEGKIQEGNQGELSGALQRQQEKGKSTGAERQAPQQEADNRNRAQGGGKEQAKAQEKVAPLSDAEKQKIKEETSTVPQSETGGIAKRVQIAKKVADKFLRAGGTISTQESINAGRLAYDNMSETERKAYFKDLNDRLNVENPLDAKVSATDMFISRAHAAKLEQDMYNLKAQADEATGDVKRELNKQWAKATQKWQRFLGETVNPQLNIWHKTGMGMQGEESLEDGTLAGYARYQMKVNKRPFSEDEMDHFNKIAYHLFKLNEADKKAMRKLFDVGMQETKSKSVSVSLNDLADRVASLRIHKAGNMSVGTPFSLAYDAGITAIELTLRAASAGAKVGEILSDAIVKGIEAMRESKHYKSLTEEERNKAERDLIENTNNLFIKEGARAKTAEAIKNEVAGKSEFTAKQANDVWQFIKEKYVNEHALQDWTNEDYMNVLKVAGRTLGMKPEDVEKAITTPKTEKNITEEQASLLETQRKFMSKARQMKSIREAPDLREKFANKKGKFSMEERKQIWDYTKENYIDKGILDPGKVVAGVSSDLGLTTNQVLDIIAGKKSDKRITDEMWKRASERRRIQDDAKRQIDYQNTPMALKVLKKIPRAFFSVKVLWHGTVSMLTHAGMYVFTPTDWKFYLRDFKKQYLLAFSPKRYENAMLALKADVDYDTFRRAGLAIDANKLYTDYEILSKVFEGTKGGKFLTYMNQMGERGFSILKILRLEVAKNLYNNLSSQLEKATPEDRDFLRREISEYVNHSTGASNIRFSAKNKYWDEGLGTAFFAWRLEASRWARILKEPAKAIYYLRGNSTDAEKAIGKMIFKRAGQQLATYAGMLALNQAILSWTKSKHKVNFFNPESYDWGLMKVYGGKTMDLTAGMRSTFRMVASLAYDAFGPYQVKQGQLQGRGDSMGGTLWNYIKGKGSPIVQFAMSGITAENYNGNVRYWGRLTSPYQQKKTPWDWVMTTVLPLPIEEAHSIYQEGYQRITDGLSAAGMKKAERDNLLGSIAMGALVGLTGVRMGEAPKGMTPLERALKDAAAKNQVKEIQDRIDGEAKILQLAKMVRQGNIQAVKDSYAKGEVGVKGMIKIAKDLRPDWMKAVTSPSVSLADRIDAYKAGTPQQRLFMFGLVNASFAKIQRGIEKNSFPKSQKEYYIKLWQQWQQQLKKYPLKPIDNNK